MPTRSHQSEAAPGTRDADVERLARQFEEVVEAVPESEREELRDYAVELLREESEAARQRTTEHAADARKSPLGVLGLALLLVLPGGALLFLLPPVGIVLLFLALGLAGWGILEMMLGKERRR